MTSAARPAVLCVTPNPALDRTLEVPGLRSGAVHRAASTRVVAGGKGVNVARALSTLGVTGRCLGPLGGPSGRMLADLAAAEGLDAAWTSVEADTRSCLILVDSDAGEATVVNEPGPRLSNEDWRRFRADVREQAADVRTVCVSGSLPVGVPPGELADLCRSLLDLGREPWVDSSGSALEAMLSVAGARLKINREEAQEVLGRSLEDVGACAAAARELMDRGMKAVVLTLGSQGAVLCTARGRWYATVPPMRTTSAVASGDSLLAGLVAASMSGLDPSEALAWGVAAGAANALAGGGARFSREQFDSILRRVEHRAIAD